MAVKDEAEEIDRLERVVAEACNLAATEGVREIRLRTDRRPTYAELLRYRARAENANLLMMVVSGGGIVLWQGQVRGRR